jgi:hypothetical protein
MSVQSAAMPALQMAAERGTKSLPIGVALASTAAGLSAAACCASSRAKPSWL